MRLAWSALPAAVTSGIADLMGSPVVCATTQRGGFSPGSADRVITAEGRRAFVKAVGPDLDPATPDLLRREASVLAGGELPSSRLGTASPPHRRPVSLLGGRIASPSWTG